MISFIVPAHNEQAGIARTLQAIHDAARVVGQPYEIIVVNDASTDATAEVARQHGVTIVPVDHRKIAATRNSGARAARGERFFFVDADTTINPRAVASALRNMDKGAVGGGAVVSLEGPVPLYLGLISHLPVILVKVVGFTGGAFMYCTREAFHATGGFDERLYWAEEGAFAMALKREGRFIVLWERVLTSGRRLRSKPGGRPILAMCARALFSPVKMFTQRASVEKIWYNSDRTGDDQMSNTPGVRIFNGIALLILLLLLTGPLWNFIPRSLTPLTSPLGKIRLVTGMILCHVGLIFWPFAIVLLKSLFGRKQWIEWLKLAAVAAFCSWQAWSSTRGVIVTWTFLGQWLADAFS